MTNAVRNIKGSECEVIKFQNKKASKSGKVIRPLKRTKAGEIKKTPNNSIKGNPHEVYPIKNKEDVKAIEQYFYNKKIKAPTKEQRRIAARNQTIWVVGINLGLRASDIVSLKWGDLLYGDGTFVDGVRRTEKKTTKFKTFWLNQYVKDAISNYINEFNPLIEPDLHVFRSREGGALEVNSVRKIIKEAGEACGIKYNLGSHTMRKTFGYHFYVAHKDDMDALIHLQRLFNHASPRVTLNYIGIEDEGSKQYYNDMYW